MRFLALVCIILVVSSSFALQAKKPSPATLKKIEALKHNKSSWASIFINMAQLHAKTLGGPVDQLIEALQRIIDDLQVKLEAANDNYDARTVHHNNEVKRLNGEIDTANADISRTEAFLNDVLYTMKAEYEEQIANLEQSIENTNNYIAEITAEREAAHDEYEAKVVEFNGAIDAINECLGLLATLHGEPDALGLAQVKKAKLSLTKVQNKLQKSKHAAMIKALVSLASSDFANKEALQKIEDMMAEVKTNLEEQLVQMAEDEENAQAAFEEEVAAKEAEVVSFEAELFSANGELDATNNKIEENQNFIVVRQNDLVTYNADLDSEEHSYEVDTQTFNDLVKEFNRELDACKEALAILESAEFAGYLADRMSSDVVIDDGGHGMF